MALSYIMYKNVCILRVMLYPACVLVWEFRFVKELQELFCEEYISLQTPLPFPGALAA